MEDTPKIRFKGFVDAWEQRKLGDLCNFINGDRSSNYPNATDFQVRGIPFVGSDSLGKTYVNKNKLRFITAEKYFQMNGLKIQKEDILYTLRGAGFGKCSISDFSEGTVASSLVGIRCNGKLLKPHFFIQWLSSSNAENEKKKAVNGSTAQNISVEDMKSYMINTPTIEEQEKISEYLLNLDNLITLHQRKCDETKELKRYMLQKMFPQNGKKNPEIRFAGFTDDWEQRKVSELAEKTYGGGTPATSNETFWNGNIPWIQSSDIADGKLFDIVPRKYITQDGLSKSAAQLVPQNSIAIITRVGVGKLAFLPFPYTTSQDFLSLSKLDVEPQFAVYALYKKLQSELNAVQGTSIKGITKKEFLAKEIMVPKQPEQVAVGGFLYSLDHLITLHQRKCDELKEVKKFMLQNMFPQKG